MDAKHANLSLSLFSLIAEKLHASFFLLSSAKTVDCRMDRYKCRLQRFKIWLKRRFFIRGVQAGVGIWFLGKFLHRANAQQWLWIEADAKVYDLSCWKSVNNFG
jgi:hypothetical protein